MKNLNRVTVVLALLAAWPSAADVTIQWNQWPYGRRSIGSYSKWWSSDDGSRNEVPVFNPNDTIWDLVHLADSATTVNVESHIRPVNEAQGAPPSQCTFAEKQVLGSRTTWSYEHLDTTGTSQAMWMYGLYYSGVGQVDYDPPYSRPYQLPMQLGDTWTSRWTWNFQGMDLVTETRENRILGQGWVRVPADTSRYYPCLVIQTYWLTTDELGLIDEERYLYEWVVPGGGRVCGSVAVVQSLNHPAGPDFDQAEHIYKMKDSYWVFDYVPPTFRNTTVWPDTAYAGPYLVHSMITDPSNIRSSKILFSLNGTSWDSLAQDSTRTADYFFHIPTVRPPATINYYLKATDYSPQRNVGTDPADAPATAYTFNCIATSIGDADRDRQLVIGLRSLNPEYLTLSLPRPARVELALYDGSGRRVTGSWRRSGIGPEMRVALPPQLPGGVYFLDVSSDGLHSRHTFTIVR